MQLGGWVWIIAVELGDMLPQLRVQMLGHVPPAQRARRLLQEPLGDASPVEGVRAARQLHGDAAIARLPQRLQADAALAVIRRRRLLARRHKHPWRAVPDVTVHRQMHEGAGVVAAVAAPPQVGDELRHDVLGQDRLPLAVGEVEVPQRPDRPQQPPHHAADAVLVARDVPGLYQLSGLSGTGAQLSFRKMVTQVWIDTMKQYLIL